MSNKKIKVLVAMSGGVDSSVAAALLLEKGYDVTGVYMKQWSDTHDVSGVCTWKEDRRDAVRVAAHLGIPFLTLDFEKEYKKWVMDYMFEEYEKGRTPNPDVLCNKFIKFGVWLDKAKELGFDFLATGHYAQLWPDPQGPPINPPLIGGEVGSARAMRLLQAKDKEKDQTYFLHQLNQKQLSHVLFPLGEYKKFEVRDLAKKFDLPTAERPESMGICFVGEVPMKEFLLQKIKPKKGNIITTSGEIIGEHDGLPFYTIGQRHLRMQNTEYRMQNGDTKPLFVVEKRFNVNKLVVGEENDPLLYKKEIIVDNLNWVAGHRPEFPLQCKVRLRHRHKMQNCELRMQNNKLTVKFEEPQKAVTPGQFAVFYSNNECLGGGTIQ